MAVDVQLNGEALTMQSAVDPYFGIQTERVIRLVDGRVESDHLFFMATYPALTVAAKFR